MRRFDARCHHMRLEILHVDMKKMVRWRDFGYVHYSTRSFDGLSKLQKLVSIVRIS